MEGAELIALMPHPLCSIVPTSAGVFLRGGIVDPVMLLDGMILDGRARVREAIEHGLPCRCVNFNVEEDQHPALVLAARVVSRFSSSQRAVLAVDIVNTIVSRPDWLAKHDRGMAARLRNERGREPLLDRFSVSARSYRRAKKLDGELAQAVFAERLSLDNAFHLCGMSAAVRTRILALPKKDHTSAIARLLPRLRRRQLALPEVGLPGSDDIPLADGPL